MPTKKAATKKKPAARKKATTKKATRNKSKPKIDDALTKPVLVPIDELTPDPHNARMRTDRSRASILASVKKYGQRRALVVQKKGMIVRAGNGTLEAAKELGWSHVVCNVFDDDDLTARGYALADNRSGDLSTWDWEVLASEMKDLDADGVDVQAIGWEQHEFDNLTAADWTPPPPPEPKPPKEAAAKRSLSFTADEWAELEHLLEAEPSVEAILDAIGEHAEDTEEG